MRPKLPCFLLLLGCTRSTELLPPADDASVDRPVVADVFVPADSFVPADGSASTDARPPRQHYPFCPTTIDIYGGINFLFPTCGGPQRSPYEPKLGLVSSEPGYDQSLAGRLAARLEDDADLTPILGTTLTVRSCAGMGESLSQLAPPLDADACGWNAPFRDERLQGMCSDNPAPVLLIAATMLDDRCHGGGSDSDAADDPAAYQAHYRERLNAFLASRSPRFALVGPRTEWTYPSSLFAMPSCRWTRPDWEREALDSWKKQPSPSKIEAELVRDLNDEFKRHHHCCRELDLNPCGPNWFDKGTSEAVNCDGATQIVNLWYDALKRWLLANDFECP